jgi:DNA-binding response OmpR family regulator
MVKAALRQRPSHELEPLNMPHSSLRCSEAGASLPPVEQTPTAILPASPPVNLPKIVLFSEDRSLGALLTEIFEAEPYQVVDVWPARLIERAVGQPDPVLTILVTWGGDTQTRALLAHPEAYRALAARPLLVLFSGTALELEAARLDLPAFPYEVLFLPFDLEELLERVHQLVGPAASSGRLNANAGPPAETEPMSGARPLR